MTHPIVRLKPRSAMKNKTSKFNLKRLMSCMILVDFSSSETLNHLSLGTQWSTMLTLLIIWLSDLSLGRKLHQRRMSILPLCPTQPALLLVVITETLRRLNPKIQTIIRINLRMMKRPSAPFGTIVATRTLLSKKI